jgi:DNA-binding transcriptional LysR family regulator
MTIAPLHRRIRLTHLQMLVSIADTGSLLRASEALHVTQPAATKTLRQLEEVVGHALVLRASSGSYLTPLGEILCKRARLVLAELRNAEDELGLWHLGAAGHVRIGSLPVATPMLVPEALRHLQAAAPLVSATVIEGSSDAMFRELKGGGIDLLVGRFYPGQDGDLATETLYESTFRLGVRAQHPLAGRDSLEWDDVLAYPWIVPPSSVRTRSALDDMFRRERVRTPEIRVETSSYLVIRKLMFGTDVICPMPVEVFDEDIHFGLARLLHFQLDLKLPPIGAVWLANREQLPAAKAFVEQLRLVSKRIETD